MFILILVNRVLYFIKYQSNILKGQNNMDERLLETDLPKESSNLKSRIWEESKKLWRIAFPAMLARGTSFGMFVVTQAFIGHIGELELAAYALIQIITVRFSNGILVKLKKTDINGMNFSTNT